MGSRAVERLASGWMFAWVGWRVRQQVGRVGAEEDRKQVGSEGGTDVGSQ